MGTDGSAASEPQLRPVQRLQPHPQVSDAVRHNAWTDRFLVNPEPIIPKFAPNILFGISQLTYQLFPKFYLFIPKLLVFQTSFT